MLNYYRVTERLSRPKILGIVLPPPDTKLYFDTSLIRIEHLPEETLPEFAPMLLGVYHPRLLLITTPSYTFNARFTAPDAPKSARNGYPDPTGRTSRIFRHSDHKFEWTVEEFTRWCEEAARQWSYEVEVSGVGSACEKDPWHRDESLGKASQVAVFRRVEGEDVARVREEKVRTDGILNRATMRGRHELLVTHQHQVSHRLRCQPKRSWTRRRISLKNSRRSSLTPQDYITRHSRGG